MGGQMKDDKRHGKGTMKYSDGDTYADADGGVYVGEWKDNKCHGKGTYTDADGDMWDGQYKNGKRQTYRYHNRKRAQYSAPLRTNNSSTSSSSDSVYHSDDKPSKWAGLKNRKKGNVV